MNNNSKQGSDRNMRTVRNTFGGGAKTTKNGKQFYEEADIRHVIKENGYRISADSVFDGEKIVGEPAKEDVFYPNILHVTESEVRTVYGKILKPDTAFINYENNTMYIIEMKSQGDGGSVDEKIQTCEYKLRYYNRMMWDYGQTKQIKHVRFYYILSDYYDEPRYKEVFRFIQDKGCDYFFNRLGITDIGLQPKSRFSLERPKFKL